jgi:hypothetical protein
MTKKYKAKCLPTNEQQNVYEAGSVILKMGDSLNYLKGRRLLHQISNRRVVDVGKK